jgi:heme exporter protein B
MSARRLQRLLFRRVVRERPGIGAWRRRLGDCGGATGGSGGCGLQFDLDAGSMGVLALGLLLGTPVLSLLGSIGAALTLGVRGGGALLSLLVLPLYIPTLIFGAGAVQAHSSGQGAGGHLSLLAALLVLAVFFAPWATTAALRIALE